MSIECGVFHLSSKIISKKTKNGRVFKKFTPDKTNSAPLIVSTKKNYKIQIFMQ